VSDLRKGRRAAVLDRWRAFGRDGLDHRPVTWQDSGKVRRGFSCGVSDAGALMVRPSDGEPGSSRTAHLIAGEVEWERWSRD
jgi:hypothetical protein